MSSGPLTLLHTSDYQVGRPYLPDSADAMIELAESVRPDVVVVAGDLTQRAKRAEFDRARELLERFGDVPVVLTPGNHDVPVYRALERLASPYRNWRRFAGTSDLDTVTRVAGATLVALSSAAPYRAVVGGRLKPRQMAFARAAFGQAPVGDHRIVVVHHHFVPVEGGGAGRPLDGGVELLREFEGMGVSAILGGHVHQLHLHPSSRLTGSGCSVPVLSTGTATSRRGRGAGAATNTVCVLRFTDDEVEVLPYRKAVGEGAFEAMDARRFVLSARARRRRGPIETSGPAVENALTGKAEKAAAS